MNAKSINAKRKATKALRQIIDGARKYVEAGDELERELCLDHRNKNREKKTEKNVRSRKNILDS